MNKTDTISRQAAIDALADMHCKSDEDGYVWIIRSDAWARIDALPSAQPEQRWIPCSERLPENRLYVLVTYKYEYGLIDHGITWYGQAEEKWNTSREVIAWMPLPEPYREGEQDENR